MATLDMLSPLPVYPPYAGGTAHIFNASRQLSRYYDVSLFALGDDPATVEWGPMNQWCRELSAFPRGKRSHHTRAHFSRPSPLDPPAVHQDWSPALAAFLRQRWATSPPNFVQLEFTTMAQYAPLARQTGATTICTAHNIAFFAQLRRARQERLLVRARRLLGAFSLWQYELRALRACDVVVVHGVSDGNALRRWLPQLPIVYVPSGIDLDVWQPCYRSSNQRDVLFVGNFAHPPNHQGALWLVRNVWPLVVRSHPHARLILAGRNPPPEIQSLAQNNVVILGTVEDLRSVYARSSVVVAPIFWGSGVRVKMLEALACGLPVVSTPLAAEGIALREGESALFAETPETFATAIARLLGDTELRGRLGSKGRALIEREYNWANIGRRLAGLYQGAREGKT